MTGCVAASFAKSWGTPFSFVPGLPLKREFRPRDFAYTPAVDVRSHLDA
jgi:hypothetical protein